MCSQYDPFPAGVWDCAWLFLVSVHCTDEGVCYWLLQGGWQALVLVCIAAWVVQLAEVDYEVLLKGFPLLRLQVVQTEEKWKLVWVTFLLQMVPYVVLSAAKRHPVSKARGRDSTFSVGEKRWNLFLSLVLAARRWYLILNPHFLLLNCITLNWVITPDHTKWLFFSTPTLCCYIWIWCTDYSEYK